MVIFITINLRISHLTNVHIIVNLTSKRKKLLLFFLFPISPSGYLVDLASAATWWRITSSNLTQTGPCHTQTKALCRHLHIPARPSPPSIPFLDPGQIEEGTLGAPRVGAARPVGDLVCGAPWPLRVETAEMKVAAAERPHRRDATGIDSGPKAARTHRRAASGTGRRGSVKGGRGGPGSPSQGLLVSATRVDPHYREKRKHLGVRVIGIHRGGRWKLGDVCVHPCCSQPPGELENLRKYDHRDTRRTTPGTDTLSWSHTAARAVPAAQGAPWRAGRPGQYTQPLPELNASLRSYRPARPISGDNMKRPRLGATGTVAASVVAFPELYLVLGGSVWALAKVTEWGRIPIAGRRGCSASRPNARARPVASASELAPGSAPREATPATEEGGGLGRGRQEAAAEKSSPRDSRRGGRTSGPERSGWSLLLGALRDFAGTWAAWTVNLKPWK